MDVISQFRAAMVERQIVPAHEIVADGRIHRCDAEGKGGRGDAAYLLHLDGIPAGGFENHRDGQGWQNWRADIGRMLSPAEERQIQGRVAAQRQQREVEQNRRRTKAAQKARAIWNAATSALPNHPYLARKNVGPVSTLRELPAADLAALLGYAPQSKGEVLTGRLLVAPVKVGAALTTIELIDEAGRKSALAGGAKAGGFWSAQKLPESDGAGLHLVIAEGISTALSILAATGHPVVAALSCGNLGAVAQQMRRSYPKAVLTVCGDLGNGQSDAEAASRDAGAMLALPHFVGGRPDDATDFNDLARLQGAEAVKLCIAAASQSHRASGPHEPLAGLVCAASIKPEAINWLWDGWLAAGKLHILAGAPGTGKTTVAIAFAATISCGGFWPDRKNAIPGDVLIWSSEDDPTDT